MNKQDEGNLSPTQSGALPTDTAGVRHRCSERVFSGERWDMLGHMCGTNATVKVNGKWWCKRHSPEGKAAKKAKDEARVQAYLAECDGRAAAAAENQKRIAAYPRLVAALRQFIEVYATDTWDRVDSAVDTCNALLRELGEL